MLETSALVDRELRCVACGSTFMFKVGEQIFFRDRQFTNPIRCRACRNQARQARQADARLCSECSATWVLSAADAGWFTSRGLHLPTRCASCRRSRKHSAVKKD